ncbi:MAG: flagellar motor protein MotB [Pseudohongiellaceae bacterium]
MLVEEDDIQPGLPQWMATFADLMALLLCFFVLLLSFSEMDVLKYKQVAGSMAQAFGVQNEITADGIPKGTSVIAQEFSPGKPQPTLDPIIQQQTVDNSEQSLQTGQSDFGVDSDAIESTEATAEELLVEKLESLQEQTLQDVEKIRDVLEDEITQNLVDIEAGFRSIVIRIRERGSFDSGSAVINPDFIPVMAQLREILGNVDGRIAVEGHTDNVPISTPLIPSNWHLSSQRALSVASELLLDDTIPDARMMVIGYADTRPHEPNDTADGRAHNRRVEIIIRQGLDEETSRELEQLQGAENGLLDTLQIDQSELRSVRQQ